MGHEKDVFDEIIDANASDDFSTERLILDTSIEDEPAPAFRLYKASCTFPYLVGNLYTCYPIASERDNSDE